MHRRGPDSHIDGFCIYHHEGIRSENRLRIRSHLVPRQYRARRFRLQMFGIILHHIQFGEHYRRVKALLRDILYSRRQHNLHRPERARRSSPKCNPPTKQISSPFAR